MKRIGMRPTYCLLLGAFYTAIVGCGGTGDDKGGNGGGSSSGVAGYSAEDLKRDIGEYMPPIPTQDGGSLEIGAPKGWEWSRAGKDYLVGFHKKDSSLNNLPRILVAVEDSPYSSLTDVSQENVDQLVTLLTESVDATNLKGSVHSIALANTACASYVDMAKKGDARVARQTLKTIRKGRLYTIRLEVYDREFTKYRDMGYAVAASMKFSSSVATEEASKVADTSESTEPVDGAPAKDAADSTEPAKDAKPAKDSE